MADLGHRDNEHWIEKQIEVTFIVDFQLWKVIFPDVF